MKHRTTARLLLSLAAMTAIALPACTRAAAPDAEKLVTPDDNQKSAFSDLQSGQAELMPLLERGKVFGDEAKRTEAAPKILPVLSRMVGAFEKLHVHNVRTTAGGQFKFQILAMQAYFGDDKTAAQLKEDLTNTDETVATEAGVALAVSDWWKASKDEAAQKKIIYTVKELAQKHSKDDQITIGLMMMGGTSPATPALRDSAMKIIADDLKGPIAHQIGAGIAGEQKLKSMEGKPLVIAGKALDGTNFTTADWKGKVILVDFWASWCGPCKAELPRVKKAYADFHAKGLEVLGVSCDQGAGPLHAFLEKNPEMQWPELFDADHPGWHPIATDFGIHGIPTMFLIDKAGVVKTVTARENFEELIPKMLEEK